MLWYVKNTIVKGSETLDSLLLQKTSELKIDRYWYNKPVDNLGQMLITPMNEKGITQLMDEKGYRIEANFEEGGLIGFPGGVTPSGGIVYGRLITFISQPKFPVKEPLKAPWKSGETDKTLYLYDVTDRRLKAALTQLFDLATDYMIDTCEGKQRQFRISLTKSPIIEVPQSIITDIEYALLGNKGHE